MPRPGPRPRLDNARSKGLIIDPGGLNMRSLKRPNINRAHEVDSYILHSTYLQTLVSERCRLASAVKRGRDLDCSRPSAGISGPIQECCAGIHVERRAGSWEVEPLGGILCQRSRTRWIR